MIPLWLALYPGDLEGRPLAEVTFTHEGPVDLRQAQELFELSSGMRFRQTAVEAGIHRLYRLERFQDIRLDVRDTPQGLTLHVHLVRRPLIGRIQWHGATTFDQDRLLRLSGVHPGDPLRERVLQDAQRSLLHFYQEAGFPDAQVSYRLSGPPDGGTTDLIWAVREGTPTTLSQARFQGTPRFSTWRLLWEARLLPGTRLSAAAVREARDRLEDFYLRQGYLEVRIAAPEFAKLAGGVVLDWTITSGEPVSVTFRGNQAVATFELKDAIPLFQSRLLTLAIVDDYANSLTRYYRDRGFPQARVTGQLTDSGVLFTVVEGSQARIRTVRIAGVPEQLRASLESTFRPLRGPFRDATWQAIRKQAQDHLIQSGFLDARVTGSWASPDSWLVQVTAGPRYLVGGVELSKWPLALYPPLHTQEDTPFSPVSIQEDALFLAAMLRDTGYGQAQVNSTIQRAGTRVDVRFQVTPGPHQRIRHVLVRGLIHTRPSVVQRQLAITPGRPLRASELLNARRALYATGLFQQVDIRPLPSDDPSQVDILVDLIEGQQARLGMGVGYASLKGPSANFGYQEDNLQGWNRRLNLTGSLSWDEALLKLTLGEPYLGGPDTSGEAGVFVHRQVEQGIIWRYGATASLNHAFRPELTGTAQTFAEYRMAPDRQGVVLRGILSGRYDTRDNLIAPTFGQVATVSLHTATDLVGQERLLKPALSMAQYLPLSDTSVLVAGLQAGWALTLGTPLPAEQAFKLGGANAVRSFQRQEGPQGAWMGLVTLEARQKVWANLVGAAFLDAGWVGQPDSGLRVGLGLGLHVVTPIGVVRLDGALKLWPRPGESAGALHLAIGERF